MESILSQIFTSDYNRTAFEDNVLKPVFLNSVKDFKLFDEDGEQEVELSETEKRTAKKVVKYGEFKTQDNRNIDLYEVTIQDFSQVKIARVGLGAIVKKLIIGNNAVFATFKYENTTNKRWRFSFIAYDSFFEEGQVQTKETNPKRYTYVFGDKDESYQTAKDRFKILFDAFQIKVKDIQEAFAVEAMSKEFFDEYRETHYAKFVKFLTGEEFKKKGGKFQLVEVQNPSPFLASVFNGDKKDARDFCKKLLGQIVFLYFIQKKGWLGAKNTNYKEGNGDKNFIQNFFKEAGENDSFYPVWLSKLFYDTLNNGDRTDDDFTMPDGKVVKIPYLNGGLFEKESEKFDYLVFPSELFADLFEFFNRFNFTIYENSPEEHTIAVDPEMLGHIFENLLEDNKDKGAFYTPKEIVQYMTQESLIEYLVTHLGDNAKEGVSQFVKQKNKEGLTDTQLNEINNLLDKVKICDPAIGSGAFPMGMLQEVFALKERIAFDLGFIVWSPAIVKENIIQNSIYGVDIEKGAVDIAQLRFWLSLIVDEEEPKPLPNLAYKIVVGNSLVGKFENEIVEIDWSTDDTSAGFFAQELINEKTDLLKTISSKQKDFFSADSNQKDTLKKEIRDLKLDILSKQLALMIETKGYQKQTGKKLTKRETEKWLETEGWKRTLQKVNTLKTNNKPFNHFDWRLDFPEILNPIVTENTGFDIVIGNPPYIKEYTSKEAFDGFRSSDYYQGKMDLWYGFACISIDLLKEKGVECFIAQNNWITSAGASIFRNKVLQETTIKIFTDFWNYKVFNSAGIQTMVYLLKKEVPNNLYPLKYSLLKDDTIKENELKNFLNFNNKDGVDEKYILNFESSLYNDSLITFNNPRIDSVLNLILENNIEYLSSNDIAQGIVYPQDKLNKKNAEKLGEGFKLNEGIFQLNEKELNNLNLSKAENEIVKPFYSTSELHKYFGDKLNKEWIIYTKSDIKNNINSYPTLKSHLDKYSTIITSDNKPYGLHRARNEDFFIGEKIISLRKNSEPSFTYTNFDCYVSQTFYSIKTDSFNLKYLTSLLNSKLIAFWLRFKGKMQGNNYQIDKEPLVNIPIIQPENINTFKTLTDYLIYLHNPKSISILSHTENKRIASHIADVLDMMIYELYFENHMKEKGLDVLQFVNPQPIENIDETKKTGVIKDFYMWYQKPENAVRQRIILIETRSKDTLAVIRKSVN